MTIREFLTARLAEDQKIAEDAYALDDNWPFWIDVDDEHHYRAACKFREGLGPARALRDVESKRRILAAYVDDDRVRFGAFESCSDSCPATVLDEVLKLLALPYDQHPDYREEWRP